MFPELATESTAGPNDEGELARVVARAVAALASVAPTVVVVEDLHWSDESTYAALVQLGRMTAGVPILLVLTFRSDEASQDLVRVLATLDRQGPAHAWELTPLRVEDTASLVDHLAGVEQPVSRRFVDRVQAITEGNPLFVEEVIGALSLEPGGQFPDLAALDRAPVPRSVQAAVWQRGRHLSPPARRLLQLAAVAGRHADVNLLAELAGLDEATLLVLLRELLTTGLVVEESADVIAFRHELTRRAVTADLLARERRAMHATLAALTERRHGADVRRAAELSRQFWEAEDWSKARHFAVRAGHHAVALGAPNAAIELFSTAIEAARRLEEPPSPEVLAARAGAHEHVGDFDSARADLEDRLGLAHQCRSRRDECVALLDLGSLWTARDYGRAGDFFRRGLNASRGLGEPDVTATALNRVGNWHLNSERPEQARHHHQEALDLYATTSNAAGTAATLDLLGAVELTLGDPGAATRRYRDAIVHFRALDDAPALASALAMSAFTAPQYLASPATWSGAVACAEAIANADESVALSGALGWHSGQALGQIGMASVLGQHGRYDEAFTHAYLGLRLAEDVEHPFWTLLAHLILGALHLDLLAASAARPELETAVAMASQAGSEYWRRTAGGFLVDACLLGGDRSAARAAIVPLADAPAPATPTKTSVSMGVRHTWRAQALLALAERDVVTAGRVIEALRGVIAITGPPGPLVELLYGRVLVALGRRGEAEQAWRVALVEAEALRVVPAAWRLHAALARSLRATRRLDEADAHAAAARV
ncbi:MAG: ATP-binding protein, partial [Acidimicrobiales bacterium]